MRYYVTIAVQLRADHGERRVTAGGRARDGTVDDVGQARCHVEAHSQVVSAPHTAEPQYRIGTRDTVSFMDYEKQWPTKFWNSEIKINSNIFWFLYYYYYY